MSINYSSLSSPKCPTEGTFVSLNLPQVKIYQVFLKHYSQNKSHFNSVIGRLQKQQQISRTEFMQSMNTLNISQDQMKQQSAIKRIKTNNSIFEQIKKKKAGKSQSIIVPSHQQVQKNYIIFKKYFFTQSKNHQQTQQVKLQELGQVESIQLEEESKKKVLSGHRKFNTSKRLISPLQQEKILSIQDLPVQKKHPIQVDTPLFLPINQNKHNRLEIRNRMLESYHHDRRIFAQKSQTFMLTLSPKYDHQIEKKNILRQQISQNVSPKDKITQPTENQFSRFIQKFLTSKVKVKKKQQDDNCAYYKKLDDYLEENQEVKGYSEHKNYQLIENNELNLEQIECELEQNTPEQNNEIQRVQTEISKKQGEMIEQIKLFNGNYRVIVKDQIDDQAKKQQKVSIQRIRVALVKRLLFMKRLKLTPKILMEVEVFSYRPFQKKGSIELITACKQNNRQKVREILKENRFLVYDFDYVQMTGLHWAAKRGLDQIVQVLVEFGADVDSQDIIGRTPLCMAIENNQISTVKLLLDNWASPWSTSTIQYNELCKDKKEIMILLTKSRKLHISLRMTPPNQRDELWGKIIKYGCKS